MMKKRDEEENEKPVVDPYTVKVRKLNNEVTERDLQELLAQFGEIVRVKIPMDEERGTNKGIGFVTFKS
jgi:RNA recognition motif-containing protein